jgi:hypothetical protein
MILEFPAPHQKAKNLEAEGSFSDVFMSVAATAKRLFRVVEMEGLEVFEARNVVELLEYLFALRFSLEIVTGGVGMAGVETVTDPLFLFDLGANLGKVLESVTEIASLTGGVLETEDGFPFRNGSKDLIDRSSDRLDSFLLAFTEMASGVDHQIRNFQ